MNGKLKGQSFGLLSMLIIQFALGMIINLFVTLPKYHPGITGNFGQRAWHGFIWAISSGGGIALTLHVIVAIGLLIASLIMLAKAIRCRNQRWILVSAIGSLGIIIALTNGLAFLGYNSNATSYIMAMGFITAAIAYSFALSFEDVSARHRRIARSRVGAGTAITTHHYRPSHT